MRTLVYRSPERQWKRPGQREKTPKEVARGGEGAAGFLTAWNSIRIDPDAFRGARMHKASSCRAAMRVTGARGRMQFRRGDRKNSAHFTFMPSPAVPCPVSALYLSSFYLYISPLPLAYSTRRLTRFRQRATVARASTATSASCIVYPTHTHARARRDAGLAVFE